MIEVEPLRVHWGRRGEWVLFSSLGYLKEAIYAFPFEASCEVAKRINDEMVSLRRPYDRIFAGLQKPTRVKAIAKGEDVFLLSIMQDGDSLVPAKQITKHSGGMRGTEGVYLWQTLSPVETGLWAPLKDIKVVYDVMGVPFDMKQAAKDLTTHRERLADPFYTKPLGLLNPTGLKVAENLHVKAELTFGPIGSGAFNRLHYVADGDFISCPAVLEDSEGHPTAGEGILAVHLTPVFGATENGTVMIPAPLSGQGSVGANAVVTFSPKLRKDLLTMGRAIQKVWRQATPV